MPIQTHIDRKRDLTVRTLTGEINRTEVIEAIRKYYAEETPTLLFLWDMTECSIAVETVTELREVLKMVDDLGGYREGEKVAFVAPKEREFLIAESVELISSMDELPFNIRAFLSLDEAMEWLFEEDSKG